MPLLANGVTDQGLGEVTSAARNGAGNPVLADVQPSLLRGSFRLEIPNEAPIFENSRCILEKRCQRAPEPTSYADLRFEPLSEWHTNVGLGQEILDKLFGRIGDLISICLCMRKIHLILGAFLYAERTFIARRLRIA